MYTQQEAEGKRLKNPCDTITEGIGINRQTRNFSKAHIDGAFQGTDREAVEMASVHEALSSPMMMSWFGCCTSRVMHGPTDAICATQIVRLQISTFVSLIPIAIGSCVQPSLQQKELSLSTTPKGCFACGRICFPALYMQWLLPLCHDFDCTILIRLKAVHMYIYKSDPACLP